MRAGSILTYPRQVLLRVPVTADPGRAGRGGQSVPCVSPARSRLVLDDLDSAAASAHSAAKCMGSCCRWHWPSFRQPSRPASGDWPCSWWSSARRRCRGSRVPSSYARFWARSTVTPQDVGAFVMPRLAA